MRSEKILPFVVIMLLPAIFALTLPFFFKLEVFTDPQQLVSILAMILLPFSGGILVVATSSLKKISKLSYRVFMPWIPVLFFFAITFLFRLEDCACWIIGLPLYLLLSSLGGLTAGFLRLRNASQVNDPAP